MLVAAKGGDQCLEEAKKGQVGDADKPCLSWLGPFTNEPVCPRNRAHGGAGPRACGAGWMCVGGVRPGRGGEKQGLAKKILAMCGQKGRYGPLGMLHTPRPKGNGSGMPK